MSKPLQVYLDDAEREGLERWARKKGWTKSQAVRAAIRALIRPGTEDPILELSGDIDGLPPDASVKFDRYLNETYVAEPNAPYGTRRRRRRPAVRR